MRNLCNLSLIYFGLLWLIIKRCFKVLFSSYLTGRLICSVSSFALSFWFEFIKKFTIVYQLCRSFLEQVQERFLPRTWLTIYTSKFRGYSRNSHIGIVILTPISLPDFTSCADNVDHPNPPYFMGLRNLHLLNRILVERTANAVLRWNFGYARSKKCFSTLCSLFLIYKKNYTSAFDLDGWLDLVPNHDVTISKNETQGSQPRTSINDLINTVRENVTSKQRQWIKPDRYCHLNAKTVAYTPMIGNGKYRLAKDPEGSSLDQLIEEFQYVTLKGRRFMQLFEVSLRAALARNCEYIVVLNPHAIGVTQDHIKIAVSILQKSKSQVVIGLTVPCSTLQAQTDETTLIKGKWDHIGIYLIAVRNTRELVLGARQFTDGVEWCSPTAESRLRANLTSFSPPWSSVYLRDRLPEVMGFEDLALLEPLLNVPLSELVEDSISVVIAVGLGHPDDRLDSIEDTQLIADDHRNQVALNQTLDLIQRNSSGLRSIQIIVISSVATMSATSTHRLFQPDTLKPAVRLEMHYYDSTHSSKPSLPNRGELINYAVENFARGSVLVFLEPGVHLPFEWDTAVFQCLERPGVGMSSFAYRLALKDKYMQRKHIGWALRCYLANWLVNYQAARMQLPTSGQPLFIYTHYLRCAGGYPKSSRRLHLIDLCLAVSSRVGRVTVAKASTASAGIPTDFYLRHGAVRGGFYLTLVTVARLLGTSQHELTNALSIKESEATRRLPLIQPDYLDGY